MNADRLESFVFEKMASSRLPGLSLALVRGGRIVYARGFGQSDIARNRAATPDTVYGAASITKSFVAVAILQLAERGKLRLSDPVNRYVRCPLSSSRGPVRIEHLLSHTCGTPALGYIEAVLRDANGIGGRPLPIAGPRDVPAFLRGAEGWSHTAPGRRWFYFNEGYVLLGLIIERVSGLPWDRYIREHILAPLGMSHSVFDEADVPPDVPLAVPYVLPREGKPRPGRYVSPMLGGDAALLTSVTDLAKHLAMFLRRGRGVLSAASFRRMIQPRVPMPAANLPSLLGEKDPRSPAGYYAYGLSMTRNFLGELLIGHSGHLVVSTGHIGFMPRSGVAVAVLGNANGYPMPQFAKAALAVLLGRDPADLPFERIDRALQSLTGTYETYRGTIRVKVTRHGDFLQMEYPPSEQSPPPTILVPERVDGPSPRFFTYSASQRLEAEFRRGSRGGDVELVLERYKFRRTGPVG